MHRESVSVNTPAQVKPVVIVTGSLACMPTQLRWHLVQLCSRTFPKKAWHRIAVAILPQVWRLEQSLGTIMASDSYILRAFHSCASWAALGVLKSRMLRDMCVGGYRQVLILSSYRAWLGIISWFPFRCPINKGYHSQAGDTKPIGLHSRLAFYWRIGRKLCSGLFFTRFACWFFSSFERKKWVKPAAPFTF